MDHLQRLYIDLEIFKNDKFICWLEYNNLLCFPPTPINLNRIETLKLRYFEIEQNIQICSELIRSEISKPKKCQEIISNDLKIDDSEEFPPLC